MIREAMLQPEAMRVVVAMQHAGMDPHRVSTTVAPAAPSERRHCPVVAGLMDSQGCRHWSDRELKRRRLALLEQVTRVLSDGSAREQALTAVLSAIEEHLGLRLATLCLLSCEGDRLLVAATSGVSSESLPSVAYQPGEGVTGQVLVDGRPRSVARMADEPRFADRIHRRREHGGLDDAFVCVPVRDGAETIGTLAADVPAEGRGRLEEIETDLGIVAALLALEARLRREAGRHADGLRRENLDLRSRLGERMRPEGLLGNSKAMQEVCLRIAQVATSEATVLITGESGTGKERVAAAIHAASRRSSGPFVRVNCAALNGNLLESELFGHEKGAFTGAIARRSGRIEEAAGGTLLLDEFGEMSPAMQATLLRVLQEREYQRVGSGQVLKADVRVIAATNRDLTAMVRQGSFRLDLYYRVNVFPIHVPPLRERREDILLLADHFARKAGARLGHPARRISTPAIGLLLSYHWPGNVRELENAIEHALVLAEDGIIGAHALPPTLQGPQHEEPVLGGLEQRVAALERDCITDALKRCAGNYAAAARELGITSRQIRYKVAQLGLDARTWGDA